MNPPREGYPVPTRPPSSFPEVNITRITPSKAVPGVIESLALCLAASEPERLDDFRLFWRQWFRDEIPGAKITVAALDSQDGRNGTVASAVQTAAPAPGVCRLWQTPYLGGKWFVEGLEVIPALRRRGLGRLMLSFCVRCSMSLGTSELYAHIHDSNTPSRNLFESMGFSVVSHGYVSTYGERRTGGSEYVLPVQTAINKLT